MLKTVIINGTGGSGKDTFVELCKEYVEKMDNYYIYNRSSVDKIKEAAVIVGWDGSKTERDRKFLSDLKILVEEYNDNNFQYMKEQYEKIKLTDDIYRNSILFLHIREPKEIQRVKEAFNAITLFIKNDNVANITSNMADANVKNYEYDIVIDNSGSLEELAYKAKEFIDILFH